MSQLPPYAVLFKTHFWDAFADRQLNRLRDRAGPGDVFVVVDETRGLVTGIGCPRVVRMTEAMAAAEGYLRHPPGNLFWYNTDYQVYHFFDQYPHYEYVFICEYDCTVNIDISLVIAAMAEAGAAFVGDPIRTPLANWPWSRLAQPYYQNEAPAIGRLLCCAAFSRAFARALQTARREHTRRALAGEIQSPPGTMAWPNNEAFVGAEIARLGAVELPLSAFGDTSAYDWAPPHYEGALPSLGQYGVLHPVLDGSRYLRSVTKLKWNVEDLFQEGSVLRQRMARGDAAGVVAMFLRHFAETGAWDALVRLRDYAELRMGTAARAAFNVARGKPATQSSTCRWSRSPDLVQDAQGAVNGQITGGFGFHTDLEDRPWWCVDLQAAYPIREVIIYNRIDQAARANSLEACGSTDMRHWVSIYRHDEAQAFGGANGSPLKIETPAAMPFRFLRLHLNRRQILHLDEVEIYV